MAAFEGVAGPQERSSLTVARPARWEEYERGGHARLAILLTNEDSAWLGLVHGLQNIGVPFRITRDYQEALRHRVVLVYPTISGRALTVDALRALSTFPEQGGTLIGVNVEGGGLQGVFGFTDARPARSRATIVLDKAHPLTAQFTDPKERVIPFSNPKAGVEAAGSLGYIGAVAPVAQFEDGTAAITGRRVGTGAAYAFGVDLGFLLLTGFNNREQGVARSYVNGFEPALDVLLRLVRDLYRAGEPRAVTLGTVPEGKDLTAIVTHDIDYTGSMANTRPYAEFEAASGIHATYFIQTKYLRDWNDDLFFDDAAIAHLRRLNDLHMEVASHSVAHSMVFNRLPVGTGEERYPAYRPFVRDKQHTDQASIFGELRVSRFLLEHFLPDHRVVSFRPGHLRNPYALPQLLEATGFRFSSSVTANNSLTHLPFRLTHGRETTAETATYEFPVTIEDEELPRLGDRLPQALAVADALARYGGLFVVLIHTDVTDHKLAFERGLIEALQRRAWFGTLREFGGFWVARAGVTVDVESDGAALRVTVEAPRRLASLAVRLPTGYQLAPVQPGTLHLTEKAGHAIISDLQGIATLILDHGGAK